MAIINSFSGVINGTAGADIIVAEHATGDGPNTIDGGDGADVIFGDHDLVFVDTGSDNATLVAAMSIDSPVAWSTKRNPTVGDTAVPYTTVLGSGAGGFDYFAVTVGAGETLIADIDFGNGPYGGVSFDSLVRLFTGGGAEVAFSDDFDAEAGAHGSFPYENDNPKSRDAYLTYVNTTGASAVFYIRVEKFQEIGLAAGETYLLNVSVTGHSATNTADFGADELHGGADDDVIYGVDGDDLLDGGDGDDSLRGGRGNDAFFDGAGADQMFGEGGDDYVYADGNGSADLYDGGEGFDSLTVFGAVEVYDFRNDTFADVEQIYLAGEGSDNNLLAFSADQIATGGFTEVFAEAHEAEQGFILRIHLEGASALDLSGLSFTGSWNAGDGVLIDGSIRPDVIKASAIQDDVVAGAGRDEVRGAAGSDTLDGGVGADLLIGGAGRDTIIVGVDQDSDVVGFARTSESTGPRPDVVRGFDLDRDVFDFSVRPTQVLATVGGHLDGAGFNAAVAAAVDGALGKKGAIEAILFDPTSGDRDVEGHQYLIVDANNDGRFTAAKDYVVELVDAYGDVEGGSHALEAGDFVTIVDDFTALLNSNTSWNGFGRFGQSGFVTYSFEESLPADLVGNPLNPKQVAEFEPLSAAERETAREAFRQWDEASGLTFIEVASGLGDMRMMATEVDPDGVGVGAFNFNPNILISPGFMNSVPGGGDGFFQDDFESDIGFFLHEIGHGLGLSHAFDSGLRWAPSMLEDYTLSIMNSRGDHFEGLGPVDYQAMAYLYGDDSTDASHVAAWSFDIATNTLRQTGFDTADVLRGSFGSDIIKGRSGSDLLFGDGGADRVQGDGGDDTIGGGLGDDNLDGGAGLDVLRGAEGADSISGKADQDALLGEDGADTLWGGDSDDTMEGGNGADIMNGEGGRDRMAGGAGRDVFVYRPGDSTPGASDVITDFQASFDRIDLKAIDANANKAGNQKFDFIGTAEFTGKAGQLRAVEEAGGMEITADVNGDGVADLRIVFEVSVTLSAADFVL